MNKKESTSGIFESIQELQTSVEKFIKYCSHLVKELEGGICFSQEGYRGIGYAAIIQDSLQITHGSTVAGPIGLEGIIEILISLLQQGIYDESFSAYSNVYTLTRKLYNFSKKDFESEIKSLAEKGMTLAEQIPKQLPKPKVYRLTKEVLQNIDISLYGVKSFLSFIEFLSKNPGDLYVGKEKKIHPKYSILEKNFYTLMDMYKKWEIKRFEETSRIGLREGDSISDADIVSWYTNIQNMPLEKQLLAFGIYLLKIGEFDALHGKEEIYAMLLEFAQKTGSEYVYDITSHITSQEEANSFDEFDENLTMYLWEFMTEIYDGDGKEKADCVSTLLDFLEEEEIDIPEDILEIQDVLEKAYSLFSFLLIGNYIANSEVKEETLRICLEYFQEKNPKHERELLDFFVEDNSDFSYESLGKKSQEEIMLLERKEVNKTQKVPNAFVKSMLEKESTEIAQHFENLYAFLKILNTKPKDLYVLFEGELHVHPKYESFSVSLDTLISHVFQLQAIDFEQRRKLGRGENYGEIIERNHTYYKSLFGVEDLQKKAFIIGTYLLALGEFESFASKTELREILLGLSKRFANGMSDIVANHIFQDENDEFQGELNGYLVNILDMFQEKEKNEDMLTAHFEVLIDFLEQTGIVIPDEILSETNIMELFHQILVNLLLRGIIGNLSYRRNVGYICLKYFENKDIDTEIKILDYLKNNT